MPSYVKQLSLLIDVPAFFFLSGVLFAMKGENLSSSLFRFITVFGWAALLHDVLFHLPLMQNLLLAATLNAPVLPHFPVLAASYWFVPVYIVVVLFAPVAIRFGNALLLSCLFISYYVLDHLFPGFRLHLTLLGVDVNAVLFYLSFYLLGFWLRSNHRMALHTRLIPIALLGIGIGLTLLAFSKGEMAIFDLQSNKFPVRLPYVAASFLSISLLAFLLTSRAFRPYRALQHMGRNAIFYFAGQGVGASVLMWIAGYGYVMTNTSNWPTRLPLMLLINVFVTVLASEFLRMTYFALAQCLAFLSKNMWGFVLKCQRLSRRALPLKTP